MSCFRVSAVIHVFLYILSVCRSFYPAKVVLCLQVGGDVGRFCWNVVWGTRRRSARFMILKLLLPPQVGVGEYEVVLGVVVGS